MKKGKQSVKETEENNEEEFEGDEEGEEEGEEEEYEEEIENTNKSKRPSQVSKVKSERQHSRASAKNSKAGNLEGVAKIAEEDEDEEDEDSSLFKEYEYQNTKNIDFFGLVKAMKRRAADQVINEKIKVVKKKLRKVDTILSLFSLTVLFVYSIEFEIFNSNQRVSSAANHVLRTLMFITNGINCYVLYFHYKYQLEMYKILKLKHPKETFKSSGLLQNYIGECCIMMIICPPGLDAWFYLPQMKGNIKVSIEAICYSVCLFKSYSLLRLPEQYSRWTNESSSAICKKNKCKADVGFLIKAEFVYRPYIIVIGSFMFVTFLLGFLIRAYESTYEARTESGTNKNDYFKGFINCFWFMVVTMMTVGFGDGYPLSHVGRIISLFACILGTLIVSLMVVSLQNTSALTIAEMRVYNEVDRLEKLDEIKERAAAMLHDMFEVYIMNKKVKELSKDASKVKEFEKLIFERFGLFSKASSTSKDILSSLKKFEMLSSTAEDTILKLNEGGIKKTEDLFISMSNAERIHKQCSKIIADQLEINNNIEQVIKNQNCLASFLTKFNDFLREADEDINLK